MHEVRLTPKALALLCFLAEHPGRAVTKDELFASVWPETAVGDDGSRDLRPGASGSASGRRQAHSLYRDAAPAWLPLHWKIEIIAGSARCPSDQPIRLKPDTSLLVAIAV
jgi:hypothetical protein